MPCRKFSAPTVDSNIRRIDEPLSYVIDVKRLFISPGDETSTETG